MADAIELIKQRIDIVELINRFVPLTQAGTRFMAPCPFHQETKPSFTVTRDGYFYCFGCQKSGDIFNFWMEYHGVSFKEALTQLAQEAGVPLDNLRQSPATAKHIQGQRSRRQQLMFMYSLAQGHFQSNLASADGALCRDYMAKRGIAPEVMQRFGLGWAKDDWRDLVHYLQSKGCNLELAMEGGLLGKSSRSGKPYDPFRARLMFPIRNSSGETIAFGGRIIDSRDEAKYINSQDSPIYKKGEHLYGLDLAGKSIRVKKQVFLTEGYMDVLTLHQFGYTNAVGGLGTALTDQQVQRLLGFSPLIFLVYDGDNAGRKAALAAAGKFLARGAKAKVIMQPEGEDIDSLLRTQGTQAFDALCEQAVPALRFCVETMREQAPRDALHWAREFIKNMQIPELISPAITYLARGLGFDEAQLRLGIRQDLEQRQGSTQRLPLKQAQEPTGARLSVQEREILRVAIRYPEYLENIRSMGAVLLLQSDFARQYWAKLEEAGEAAGYELEGQMKTMWDRFRGLEAPPRTNPSIELRALEHSLSQTFGSIQQSSISDMLRQSDISGNFESGLELLGGLQRSAQPSEEKAHE